jgi:hypothetical protein
MMEKEGGGYRATISALLYADDTALLSMTYEGMCRMVQILDEKATKWGLSVSIIKRKVMVFHDQGGQLRQPLILRVETVKEVTEFKYLGLTLASTEGDKVDVRRRIGKGGGCFKKLRRRVWRQGGAEP